MERPLVSVVVTTYNQGQYIEETLASVFAQTFTDYEVIVVDDGSTDDTMERLALFGNAIRLIRQPNTGVAGSRNTGVAHAHGQFIAFLDGDDIWHKDKLAIQVGAALAHPEAGLIAVDGVQFEDKGSVLSHTLFYNVTEFGSKMSNSLVTDNFYIQLLQSQLISTISQVMVPAAVLRSIGPSDSRFPRASDYDLYLRICRQHPFTLVRQKLVKWRYLPTSASGSKELRSLQYLPEDVEILRKNARYADASSRKVIRKVIREKTHRAAQQLYVYGKRSGGQRLATRRLLSLLRKNPTSIWIPVYLVALWSPPFLINYSGQRLRALRDAMKHTFNAEKVRKS